MSDTDSGREYAQPVYGSRRLDEGVYQAGPWYGEPLRPVRSLQPLQTIAVIAAGLVAVFDVAYTLAFFAVRDEYHAAVDEGLAAWEVWTWADWLAFPLFGAMILSYVVTCLWLWRARENSVALTGDPSAHKRRRIWVWLGWVVPIVAVWFPFQVVRDVLRESSPSKTALPPHGPLLGWWWTCWLLYVVLGRVAGSLQTSEAKLTDDALATMGTVFTFSSLAALVGVVLWIRIVLLIGAGQRESAARRGIVIT